MSIESMANNSLPNIPWEDRPAGQYDVVWRFSGNPIIPRDLIPSSNSIFNSAVVPLNGRFAGVFRGDNKKRGGALYDDPTGRIAIYYGGADTVTALAFAQRDELIDYIKRNSEV